MQFSSRLVQYPGLIAGNQTMIMRLLCCLLLLPTAAWGGIRPEFAGIEKLPAGGILVLPYTVTSGVGPELESTLKTSIKNAVQAAEFEAEKGSILRLYNIGGYRQLLLIGAGSDALVPGGATGWGVLLLNQLVLDLQQTTP